VLPDDGPRLTLLTLTRWLSSASRAGVEDYRVALDRAVQERAEVSLAEAKAVVDEASNRLRIREFVSSHVGVTVDENVRLSATA
jgi:hypothetical protein